MTQVRVFCLYAQAWDVPCIHIWQKQRCKKRPPAPSSFGASNLHYINLFASGRKPNSSSFLDSPAKQKYMLWGILGGSKIIYRAITSSLEYTWNKTSINALLLKEVPLSIHALHIQYFTQEQRALENAVLMTIYLGQRQSCSISTCVCTPHLQLPLPKHIQSRARKEISQIETKIPLLGCTASRILLLQSQFNTCFHDTRWMWYSVLCSCHGEI